MLSDAALLKRYARQIVKLQAELEVSIIYCNVCMQYFVYDSTSVMNLYEDIFVDLIYILWILNNHETYMFKNMEVLIS